jgi:hypothetical protein
MHSFASGGEPVKPLTQVNKEFLVVVHIVYNKDSSAEMNVANIQTTFTQLNTLFKPIGVSFSICEYRYIYNYQYDTLTNQQLNEVSTRYNALNRINMYFVEAFVPVGGECGVAALGGIAFPSTGFIFIKKSCPDINTIGHEMGHFFSLLHTFQGSGSELVNESNCSTAGDDVCDTPSDPYSYPDAISLYITNGCQFISTKKDANGQFYNPDLGNIMTYYTPCVCAKFSHDQYEKMATYYLANPVAW